MEISYKQKYLDRLMNDAKEMVALDRMRWNICDEANMSGNCLNCPLHLKNKCLQYTSANEVEITAEEYEDWIVFYGNL